MCNTVEWGDHDRHRHIHQHFDILRLRKKPRRDNGGPILLAFGLEKLTALEAQKVSQAGIQLFVVFEAGADPQLTIDNGLHHGQIAYAQAATVGQPKNSAIYFALEHFAGGYGMAAMPAIKIYIEGVRQGLRGDFKIGVYSNGLVCDELLKAGLVDYTWLSASTSFIGSQEFARSGKWSLLQKEVDQNWQGLSVDTDEAKPDIGAFSVAVSAAAAEGAAPRAGAAVAAAPLPSPAASSAVTGFRDHAKNIATTEWTYFGGQTYDIQGHLNHGGHKEGEDGF